MDIKVRVKRTIKYRDRLVPAGEILTLSKKELEELKVSSDVLIPLDEEARLEREKALAVAQVPTSSELFFQRKQQLLEEEERVRETEAILFEKQAEEQARLAKAAAARLRGKTKDAMAVA